MLKHVSGAQLLHQKMQSKSWMLGAIVERNFKEINPSLIYRGNINLNNQYLMGVPNSWDFHPCLNLEQKFGYRINFWPECV